jgi:Recombination enhancement, RecA-dependent nuclease
MNKADAKRLEIIHRLPCMACVKEGQAQPNRTEAHHVVSQSYRKHSGGHQATLPLCSWHHRSEPIMGQSKTEMGFIYGPSLETSKAFFVKRYGTELDLLANIDKVING